MDIFIDIFYSILTYSGLFVGLICGIYILNVAGRFKSDPVTKKNLYFLGIVDLLVAFLYLMAILHVDSLAPVSNFSKLMRPLTMLLLLFPTFICYRMDGHR